jgi:3,4-dihydroxy 2-butanone 4-phosphate synthase / GTP cyclohydrolase II
MRLMTNNPAERAALDGYGLSVSSVVPLVVGVHDENVNYLEAKRDKIGHSLPADIRGNS